jgi:hypothetical protein
MTVEPGYFRPIHRNTALPILPELMGFLRDPRAAADLRVGGSAP